MTLYRDMLIFQDSVPQGRLKVVEDCIAANFQPSPFDKLRAGSAGLVVLANPTQD
jgi:hypothetical protein